MIQQKVRFYLKNWGELNSPDSVAELIKILPQLHNIDVYQLLRSPHFAHGKLFNVVVHQSSDTKKLKSILPAILQKLVNENDEGIDNFISIISNKFTSDILLNAITDIQDSILKEKLINAIIHHNTVDDKLKFQLVNEHGDNDYTVK